MLQTIGLDTGIADAAAGGAAISCVTFMTIRSAARLELTALVQSTQVSEADASQAASAYAAMDAGPAPIRQLRWRAAGLGQ